MSSQSELVGLIDWNSQVMKANSLCEGVKIKTSEDSLNAWAVSLTEWDGLESHAKFVQRSSSAAFFETLSKLSSGPPTIDHYEFGDLRSLGESDCSRVLFTNDREGEARSISAESLDHEFLICSLSPLKSEHENLPRDVKKSFHVLWYSYERKVQRSNL